jgi:hypothetical protein
MWRTEMTKKSTEELVAEAKALRARLQAIRDVEAAKTERNNLEKEIRELHRATSTKWKIAGKLLEHGKKAGKEVGKFFVEETRNFISEHDWGTCQDHPKYNGETVPKNGCTACQMIYDARQKDEKEEGEGLL